MANLLAGMSTGDSFAILIFGGFALTWLLATAAANISLSDGWMVSLASSISLILPLAYGVPFDWVGRTADWGAGFAIMIGLWIVSIVAIGFTNLRHPVRRVLGAGNAGRR